MLPRLSTCSSGSVSFTYDVRVFPSPSGGENKAECVFDAEGAAGACGDW